MKFTSRVTGMLMLSLAVSSAVATEPPGEPTTLPRVKATKPFMPFCTSAICNSLEQALLPVSWTIPNLELPDDGPGVGMTKEQFCGEMKEHKPKDCDLDNPPSTPGYDSGWVSNGCGDGSFKAGFAEVISGLTLSDHTGDLNNPLPGISFLGACRAHDACYSTMVPKANCDRNFYSHLTAACDAGSATYSAQCNDIAGGYSGAVSLFGDGPYSEAQKARECAAWANDMRVNQCV